MKSNLNNIRHNCSW